MVNPTCLHQTLPCCRNHPSSAQLTCLTVEEVLDPDLSHPRIGHVEVLFQICEQRACSLAAALISADIRRPGHRWPASADDPSPLVCTSQRCWLRTLFFLVAGRQLIHQAAQQRAHDDGFRGAACGAGTSGGDLRAAVHLHRLRRRLRGGHQHLVQRHQGLASHGAGLCSEGLLASHLQQVY